MVAHRRVSTRRDSQNGASLRAGLQQVNLTFWAILGKLTPMKEDYSAAPRAMQA
jgi:hypothetical protein